MREAVSGWGFGAGAGVGAVAAATGLMLLDPDALVAVGDGGPAHWLTANLGTSAWLFAVVLALYVLHLGRLKGLLRTVPSEREVVELDQLIDVWIHLFIGIGVIWTAIGMRSALQSALGDPGTALTDTAGNVLRKLVDGGILLALTTTIVGGVGGYVMRLIKTLTVGAALHEFFEARSRRELSELVAASLRIESLLSVRSASDGVATGIGRPCGRL